MSGSKVSLSNVGGILKSFQRVSIQSFKEYGMIN